MVVIGPLVKTGSLSPTLNLWFALFPIGFLFGYILQRAGLADARRIAALFYLKRLDVLWVLLSALVTALLGLWGLGYLGLLDLQQLYWLPTYLLPMGLGGLVFGLGMVLGGYCPGTAFAALATGKGDALVFLLGLMSGILLFGEGYPLWSEFHQSDFRGVVRLDQVLGLPLGLTIALVVFLALGLGLGFRRLQSRFWQRAPQPPDAKAVPILVRFALALALLFALLPEERFFPLAHTAGGMGGWLQPWEDPLEPVFVNPAMGKTLADRYADRLRVFDLRPAPHRDPFLTPETLAAQSFAPGTVVLVYGASEASLENLLKTMRRRGIRAFGVIGEEGP